MAPRCNPLVAPFNDTQILIAGGLDQQDQKLRDRVLYDIKDKTLKSLPSGGAFEAESNQSVRVEKGRVASFIQKLSGEFVLMHHTSDQLHEVRLGATY